MELITWPYSRSNGALCVIKGGDQTWWSNDQTCADSINLSRKITNAAEDHSADYSENSLFVANGLFALISSFRFCFTFIFDFIAL